MYCLACLEPVLEFIFIAYLISNYLDHAKKVHQKLIILDTDDELG